MVVHIYFIRHTARNSDANMLPSLHPYPYQVPIRDKNRSGLATIVPKNHLTLIGDFILALHKGQRVRVEELLLS